MNRNGPDSRKMKGRYANFFRVGYNAFEFIVDFGQSYAEQREERFHTRIVTSPHYARDLIQLLLNSISQYERNFGSKKRKID